MIEASKVGRLVVVRSEQVYDSFRSKADAAFTFGGPVGSRTFADHGRMIDEWFVGERSSGPNVGWPLCASGTESWGMMAPTSASRLVFAATAHAVAHLDLATSQ